MEEVGEGEGWRKKSWPFNVIPMMFRSMLLNTDIFNTRKKNFVFRVFFNTQENFLSLLLGDEKSEDDSVNFDFNDRWMDGWLDALNKY